MREKQLQLPPQRTAKLFPFQTTGLASACGRKKAESEDREASLCLCCPSSREPDSRPDHVGLTLMHASTGAAFVSMSDRIIPELFKGVDAGEGERRSGDLTIRSTSRRSLFLDGDDLIERERERERRTEGEETRGVVLRKISSKREEKRRGGSGSDDLDLLTIGLFLAFELFRVLGSVLWCGMGV